MSGPSVIENKLPVFTIPQQQIAFYADDPSTHKQILTIYNPYDFNVKFRVTCTDCRKYTVSAAQGIIKSSHSIDIVIHHKKVCLPNIGASDTVRVQLYIPGQLRDTGKKDIPIILLASRPEEGTSSHPLETERFQPLVAESTTPGNLRQHPFIGHAERGNGKCQLTIYVIATVICLVALMLPNEGDAVKNLPSQLHISQGMRIVAGYILGLITAGFVRI